MIKKLVLLAWLVLCALGANPQSAVYTVDELLSLYMQQSTDIKNNKLQYQIDSLKEANKRYKYWFQSDIAFSLPYNKSIEAVIQPDGSNKLTETNYIYPTARLNLRKKIAFLGGDLSVYSSINNWHC